MLRRWYELWQRHRVVLVQLMAPYNAPFMYGQHRFGAIFQAVEDWNGAKFSGRDASKSDHAARVKSIIDAATAAGIDSDTIACAESVLHSRNDKKLSDKISEVIRATDTVGETVFAASPDFGARVTGARANVAHPKNGKASFSSEALFWHGEILLWVMRTCLLTEVGLTDIPDRVIGQFNFKRAIAAIQG